MQGPGGADPAQHPAGEGLGLGDTPERPPRYSVRDLEAFQLALLVYRRAAEALGADHPAAAALRELLELLTRGCHRFERGAKADSYREARDAASRAVCELLLDGSESTDALVTAIEQDLMASLAGLLRRLELADDIERQIGGQLRSLES